MCWFLREFFEWVPACRTVFSVISITSFLPQMSFLPSLIKFNFSVHYNLVSGILVIGIVLPSSMSVSVRGLKFVLTNEVFFRSSISNLKPDGRTSAVDDIYGRTPLCKTLTWVVLACMHCIKASLYNMNCILVMDKMMSVPSDDSSVLHSQNWIVQCRPCGLWRSSDIFSKMSGSWSR